jgi:DNA-directed RNA polymerase specialized sigma24 family protein
MLISDASISVSTAIDLASLGDERAVELLWDHFFTNLQRLGKQKQRSFPCQWADEEDLALSVFHLVVGRGLAAGRFPEATDRKRLWWLLSVCLRNKAISYWRKSTKRGKHQFQAVDGQQPDRESPPAEADDGFRGEFRELLRCLSNGEDDLEQIALLKLAGHTQEQIAEELDLGLRTVQRKFQRIRWSLLGLLKLDGLTEAQIAQRLDLGLETVERELGRIQRGWAAEAER